MMLSVHAVRPADGKSNESESVVASSTREITSTDNNENVGRAVCNRSLANCELMTVSQAVSVGDFCLAERDFVAQKQDEMAHDFIAWCHPQSFPSLP